MLRNTGDLCSICHQLARVLCLERRQGRSSLLPDVLALFWRRPFRLTCSPRDYSAKLPPSSLTFAKGLDHYSPILGLYFNDGSLIKAGVFPNVLGDEHSPTVIDHSLGHARSHRISGEGHKGSSVSQIGQPFW
jgi:hypothetical protein